MEDIEFGHVFTVTVDGKIADGPGDVYAPEVYNDDDVDMTIDGVPYRESSTWDALTGYTGQYGYRGPIMHASEFVGGGLERDILSEPGTYVMVVVDCLPEDDDDDPEPAGWAILRMVTGGE